MGIYVDALLLLGAVALIAGIVLTLAAKFMAVPVNETQVKIRECLPGANCGACGFAGCDDYAGALADDPDNVPLNACVPGGAAAASAIAEVLGKDASAAGGGEAKIARVHCRGIDGKKCGEGDAACKHGCIACGACVEACPFGAMHIIDGVAVVDRAACVGCGACETACPNGVISVAPSDSRVFVGCSSKDKGADTRKACSAGCLACGKCVNTCKFGAIEIVDNHAVIDHEKCKNCGMCAKVCPANIIIVMPKNA